VPAGARADENEPVYTCIRGLARQFHRSDIGKNQTAIAVDDRDDRFRAAKCGDDEGRLVLGNLLEVGCKPRRGRVGHEIDRPGRDRPGAFGWLRNPVPYCLHPVAQFDTGAQVRGRKAADNPRLAAGDDELRR
jgi:hypothetical protein